MKVKLLFHTPLSILSYAARISHESNEENFNSATDDISEKDLNLIKKLITLGHTSPFEHILYNFEIFDLSRAALQELARHRIASYTVRSTRFVLKKLIKNKKLEDALVKISPEIDKANIQTLKKTVEFLNKYPNDIAKYSIPEALKTHLIMSINARSLMNFINLRSSKKALKEMRILSREIFNSLPQAHTFIFENFYHKDEK
jgi:thymidylate synthase (FAD)